MLELYFAYGSNMDEKQLEDCGIRFEICRSGYLKDWEIHFNKRSEKRYRGFSVANIMPKAGSTVEGILYTLREEDFCKLDKKEGYPEHYSKQQVLITLPSSDEAISAITYVARQDKIEEGLKPAQEYMEHLLAGKKYLSPEYIAKLQSIEVSF